MRLNSYINTVLSIVSTVAVLIAGVLILNLFYQSYQTMLVKGSVDLRNRITGTRVALTDQDPYTYTWKVTDPIEWADPYADPVGTTSRLTVSPGLLLFHLPLSYLRFDQTIVLWFFIEWLALLITVLILLKYMPSKNKKLLFFVLTTAFTLSIYWRIHILAGQVYIFYALASAVIMVFLQRNNAQKLAGIAFAILCIARPPYMFLLVPFLVLWPQYKTFILSFFMSLISTFILTGLVFGFPIWRQYAQSMILHDGISSQNLIERNYSTDIYPQLIENVSFLRGDRLPLLEQEDSFRGSLNKHFGLHANVTTLLFLMGAFTILAAVFIYAQKNILSIQHVFLLGITLVLVIEYLLPAKHYMYANIQWIIPLAIVIQQWKSRS